MSDKKKDRSPAPGEMVWLKPTGVPVPYEVRLRGGVTSGQRGLSPFTPAMNKKLQRPRVPKMTGPEEVAWSSWWARRYVQDEVDFCSKKEIDEAKAALKKAATEEKKTADEAKKAADEAKKVAGGGDK